MLKARDIFLKLLMDFCHLSCVTKGSPLTFARLEVLASQSFKEHKLQCPVQLIVFSQYQSSNVNSSSPFTTSCVTKDKHPQGHLSLHLSRPEYAQIVTYMTYVSHGPQSINSMAKPITDRPLYILGHTQTAKSMVVLSPYLPLKMPLVILQTGNPKRQLVKQHGQQGTLLAVEAKPE
jgi:hypothetical protein